MLGRLRMDIETCKEAWVKMCRRVFETDKTFHGIPYKQTLFKASKLESAIKEIVRDHTVGEGEEKEEEEEEQILKKKKEEERPRAEKVTTMYSMSGMEVVGGPAEEEVKMEDPNTKYQAT